MRKLLFVVAVLGAACTPSFQAVYEGNVHFEHCYALEENPNAGLPDKSTCWRDWSEHYTFGQTRDRVQYANSRYVALTRVGTAPSDEAMMMAAPGETPRTTIITAPAPTSAFAPPPKVLDAIDAGMVTNLNIVPIIDAGVAPTLAPVLMMPAQTCGDTCGGDYRGCSSNCEGDAGTKSKGCTSCVQKYRTCMRGCFK